jgi:hypothetical protein
MYFSNSSNYAYEAAKAKMEAYHQEAENRRKAKAANPKSLFYFFRQGAAKVLRKAADSLAPEQALGWEKPDKQVA